MCKRSHTLDRINRLSFSNSHPTKMTIAHTGIKLPAAKHAAVVAWYEAALAPLGYSKAVTFLDGLVVGFLDSASGNVDWWLTSTAAAPPGNPGSSAAAEADFPPTHTAFAAKGECLCGHDPMVVPVVLEIGEPAASCHATDMGLDRATVDAFHKAAVAAGGKCNGPPGVRAHSGPGYYAAFVLDPAGNNIEAVYDDSKA